MSLVEVVVHGLAQMR